MYLYPCKTGGKCRQLMFEKEGWDWPFNSPRHGTYQVWIDSKFGFQKHVGSYKCCTQCHLPLNKAESIKANKLYGYTLEDDKPDDEFLELLDGF